MRLRRLEIRRFRKLAGPVVLDGLGDGITVVGGDNEEGKSTVLAALKAALFELHGVGGAVREQMTPHDGGVPEVLVDLEVAGRPYRLHKAFRKGGVTLDTPRGRLAGDAAELALVDLLRFERRTAREARPQNLGLQAIFWVDQGTSFAGFDSLEAGRDRLSAALEAEAGVLAAGDRGRRLLPAVTRAVREFWTPTGKETGALAEAGRRVQSLAAAHDGMRQRRQAYDATIDRLARLRDERRRAIEADELGRARGILAAARDALEALDAMEADLARLRGEARLCESRWQRLDDEVRRRRELAREVETAGAAAALAAQDAARLSGEAGRAEVALERATAAEVAAIEGLAAVEQDHERVAGQRRLAEVAARLDRLAADHAVAAEADAAVAVLRAALVADPATPERLAEAVEAQAARREAAAALRAVATRLDFAPQPGAAVTIAGRPHAAGEPLHVTGRTEIALQGFGGLTVQPGGSDVEQRRSALHRAEARLAAALATMGAADLAAARSMLDVRQGLERDLVEARSRLGAVLDSHGSRGLAALADQVAGAEAELAALAGRFGHPDQAVDLGAALAAVEGRRREARTARDGAAETREAAARSAVGLRTELARREARAAELAEQLDTARRSLARDVERIADAPLQADHVAAAGARGAAELRLAAVEGQVAARDPELIRDRLAQAERRLSACEADAAKLEREIRDVEIELRSSEAQALGEGLADVEGELAQAEAERERLLRLARAWKLLHDELAAALGSARDALLVPVRQRIGPYLRRLFPDAEVVLDPETLALERLRRDGVDERFGQLSLGTREQLAIVVRLALAGLLQEKEGHAPCLVLDDALVYADEVRLDMMKTILQQAGRDLQILILTCRPRDYRGLEARFLRLEDCRG